jgi:ABC-type nitrate/sulfonate/bicarbonate transport system substrate-binding protein
MKFAILSGWLIFFLILGFTARLAPAQEKMRVAIPLFPTAAFPVLVANDRGFFQKEGLTVERIRINSAPTTYQALISGDVHMAAGAPTGLLPSHAQGADVIALGSWDNLVPYVWLTRNKINDIRELRGKKVGVNRAGSKPWLIIHVLLQDAGLDPVKDLTLLQMGGGSPGAGRRVDERRYRCHSSRCAAGADHEETGVFHFARKSDAFHECAAGRQEVLSGDSAIDRQEVREGLC